MLLGRNRESRTREAKLDGNRVGTRVLELDQGENGPKVRSSHIVLDATRR